MVYCSRGNGQYICVSSKLERTHLELDSCESGMGKHACIDMMKVLTERL